MIRKAYMVFDSACGVYMGPLIFLTDGEAIRDFTNLARKPDTKVGSNPEHFTLYRVGEVDDAKGTLKPCDKECIATAQEVLAIQPELDLVDGGKV